MTITHSNNSINRMVYKYSKNKPKKTISEKDIKKLVETCNNVQSLTCIGYDTKTLLMSKILNSADIDVNTEDRIKSQLKFYSQEQRDKISNSLRLKRKRTEKKILNECINEFEKKKNKSSFDDFINDIQPDSEYLPIEDNNESDDEEDDIVINNYVNEEKDIEEEYNEPRRPKKPILEKIFKKPSLKKPKPAEDDYFETDNVISKYSRPKTFNKSITYSFWDRRPRYKNARSFIDLLIHYVKFVLFSTDNDNNYKLIDEKKMFEKERIDDLLYGLITKYFRKINYPFALGDEDLDNIINEENITNEHFYQQLQNLQMKYSLTTPKAIGQRALEELFNQIFKKEEIPKIIVNLKDKMNEYFKTSAEEFEGIPSLNQCYPF